MKTKNVTKPKIVFVHLLNDYSGSPRVLAQVADSFVKKGFKVDLYTSSSTKKGFLSNIDGVNSFHFSYRWSAIKVITLLYFFMSQISLFVKLMKYRHDEVVFYVNTILPIGASLAGKVLNKRVVYHVHETSIRPKIFKKLLFYIARKTANEAIYVSQFLLDEESLIGVKNHVVYNSLSEDFIMKSNQPFTVRKTKFRVLMLSSLKKYKGVDEFVELAKLIQNCEFELIINATQSQINEYFDLLSLPLNLTIYPSQQDVHKFYQRANLVVNLSHPDKWVETFGLTALEAMSYSIPVIVPPVGGIAEIVDDEKTGFKIDVRKLGLIKAKIKELMQNRELHKSLSFNAKEKSTQFTPCRMISEIESVIY